MMDPRKIFVSSDYNLFKENTAQRVRKEGNSNHKEIEDSLKLKGWLDDFPMKVYKLESGKYVIVKGHKRFRLAVALGIPIKFQVLANKREIFEEEFPDGGSEEKWSLQNLLESFAHEGKNPNYMILMRYCEDSGISLTKSLKFFSYSVNGMPNIPYNELVAKFKKRKLEFGDTTHAEDMARIIKKCKYEVGVTYATRDGFAEVMSAIVRSNIVNIPLLLKRMKAHVDYLNNSVTSADYYRVLSHVYNYKQGMQIDFRKEIKNWIHRTRVEGIKSVRKNRKEIPKIKANTINPVKEGPRPSL